MLSTKTNSSVLVFFIFKFCQIQKDLNLRMMQKSEYQQEEKNEILGRCRHGFFNERSIL